MRSPAVSRVICRSPRRAARSCAISLPSPRCWGIRVLGGTLRPRWKSPWPKRSFQTDQLVVAAYGAGRSLRILPELPEELADLAPGYRPLQRRRPGPPEPLTCALFERHLLPPVCRDNPEP